MAMDKNKRNIINKMRSSDENDPEEIKESG